MQKLLLLHGALGSKEQFGDLASKLEKEFDIAAINFSGHGGAPIPDEAFSIEMFAMDVIKWMDENSIKLIDIFGYSMGGYVGLYMARHYPGRTGKIFTLATKFDWTEETAEKEKKMLDPEKIKEKVPDFAEQLIQRHGKDNWQRVLKKTGEMMLSLGKDKALKEEDLQQIENEVQVGVGDSDKMVTLNETIEAYRNLRKRKAFGFGKDTSPAGSGEPGDAKK